jgi:hypothetical protein
LSADLFQIQFRFERVQHGIVDSPSAMKTKKLCAGRTIGSENRSKMLSPVCDESAIGFHETYRHLRTMGILFD